MPASFPKGFVKEILGRGECPMVYAIETSTVRIDFVGGLPPAHAPGIHKFIMAISDGKDPDDAFSIAFKKEPVKNG